MRISRDREQTEGGENIPCQWFKCWVEFEEALSKQWIKIFACTFVMNGKDPCKMIQSCGANINQWNDLLAHAILPSKLICRSMHPCKFFGHFNAKILCKGNTDHDIARVNLMTQPNRFDLAMTIDRVANTNHWIGKVDEPCIRTE